MEKLILTCIEYLKLKAPVDVRFVTRIKFKNTRAYHISLNKEHKVTRHVIRILMCEDARDTQTIIAHEFVHAWQAEYAKYSVVHGKQFMLKAFELRAHLINKGFKIAEDIYCKETDVN